MASTKEERNAIKGLHAMNSPIDLNSVWKKEPTLIATPTNHRPPRDMNVNPFSANPNQKQTRSSNKVGNVTARQTMASGSRDAEGRPAKRQKFDQTFGLPSVLPITLARKVNRARPPLAPERPEPFDVDEIESSEDERKRKRRRSSLQNAQSSADELNLLAPPASTADIQRSRYSFPGNKIAPDGPATVLNEDRFGDPEKHSPGHDSIKDYTSEPEFGRVKDKVAKIEEALSNSSKHDPPTRDPPKYDPPKYDLSKMGKGMGKAKRMQPKLPKDSVNQRNGVSKPMQPPSMMNRDPIASSSTVYKTTNQRKWKPQLKLPIKEAYFGPDYVPRQGDRVMALYWGVDGLIVKVNEVDIFSCIGRQWEGFECPYSTAPPLIDLRRRDGSSGGAAIKFDSSSRSWKGDDYEKLLAFLTKNGVQTLRVKEGNSLWEMVEMCRSTDRSRGKEHIMQATKKTLPVPKQQSISVASSSSMPESSERMSSGPAPQRSAVASYLRRSSRTMVPQTTTPAPDQDEAILVYPQGAPGAVNLTNGDLARLEPGEYLNDTLIEFGLKHWLGELEMSNPELASQVHVFNSFFYKKLVHKKDPEQAFESLRKWTSKFDIFQKNLHWYLAIICEPEHVLNPTPEIPPTRKDTRSSLKQELSIVPTTLTLPDTTSPTVVEMDADIASSSITPSDTALAKQSAPPEDSDDDMYVPSSEVEVERSLYDGFKSACHIGDYIPVSDVEDDDDALSYVSDRADVSPPGNSEKSPSIMDETLDSGPSEVAMSADTTNLTELAEDEGPTPLKLAAVPPARFYGSIKAKGKQKAIPKPNLQAMDVDKEAGDDVVVLDSAPKYASLFSIPSISNECFRTYIFTLDSLGTRHPRAITKLATYLKLEAKDKKGIPNASLAQGKMASVPTQPNFCDCGVYLIHFVQTFMTDPKRYCRSILNQKTTKLMNKERQAEWHDEKVASMREDIARRIRNLSKQWKEERRLKAAKEIEDGDDKVNMVDSSDSDIVVDDVNIVGPSPKKGRAKRMRG
ncbi:hypothetical protein M413DRAFT_26515 [Hebeloma cylindrosporum]|uniref:Ubiquitin-like protease family profile domain-containing protein n=1 Tax=Hebeloma cylindrosporum TaxID=76867 RepID=A0A0C2YQR5_HEBCY|nr:hypothetical protein M413DRAFT_26515 [Hebeloma cylindrosporum h7]